MSIQIKFFGVWTRDPCGGAGWPIREREVGVDDGGEGQRVRDAAHQQRVINERYDYAHQQIVIKGRYD
jgi:hypothetical protein